MSLTKVTTNGLEHGLINTIGNSVPDDGFKRFAEKDRPSMEKKKKEDEKIVKAQYLHKDGKNERLERPYANWAGSGTSSHCFLSLLLLQGRGEKGSVGVVEADPRVRVHRHRLGLVLAELHPRIVRRHADRDGHERLQRPLKLLHPCL